MGRRRRRNNSNEIADGLLLLAALVAFQAYSKTRNVNTAISYFIVFIALVIVGAMIYKGFRKKKLLNSGINVVDTMTGEEFEYFLLAHFKNLGYKGHTTPKTNDYGADLVLIKDGSKIILQAKRWTSKVGIEAIQQIVAAINYYNADKGIVITNNFFTKNAYVLAKKNNIELWDRNKLIEIMSQSQGKELASTVTNGTFNLSESISSSQSTNVVVSNCPKCGCNLIMRNGKRGKFWGCSNFPKCRYTKDL